MENQIFTYSSVIWFLIGFGIFLLELAFPGLVLFFFGIGAWIVAILVLLFDVSVNVQLIIFLSVSIISLIFLRKYFKDLFKGKIGEKNTNNFEDGKVIGSTVMVIEKISPNIRGKVEFRGTNWLAESDEILESGEIAEIISKENLTIKVKSIK